MASDTLAECFARYNTDKQTSQHNYAAVYEVLFAARRQSVRRLLEIGIGTVDAKALSNMAWQQNYRPGASLRAWRDYFPNALIVGLDIDPKSMLDDDRVRTAVCDSTNPESVKALPPWIQDAAFDVIIDDGLHSAEAQQKTLLHFWPLLKSGGCYVIEDIYWNQRETAGHPLIHPDSCASDTLRAILSLPSSFVALPNQRVGEHPWAHDSVLRCIIKP